MLVILKKNKRQITICNLQFTMLNTCNMWFAFKRVRPFGKKFLVILFIVKIGMSKKMVKIYIIIFK